MPSEHARFNPSGMSMYLNCHYCATHNGEYPNTTSVYAEEGTMLHSDAEKAIIRNGTPENEFLSTYTDFCIDLKQKLPSWSVEKRLRYNDDVWGTIDFVAWSDDELWIVDLKGGAGVSVSATNNTQLMTYAGMALTTQNTVHLVIIQPRLENPIRQWTTDADTIREHMKRIDAMQVAVMQGSEEANAGDHCKWCKCKIACPVATEAMVRLVKGDDELPQLLKDADIAEERIKAIRARAYELADGGHPIPGYKLVQKRASKVWVEKAEENLRNMVDDVSTLYDNKLKSPAQLEKLIGKEVAKFYNQVSSGTVLVPEDDKRPAVFSAKNLGDLASKLKALGA